jgi:hypothetical protein
VLADPRARKRERRTDLAVKQAFYRLANEKRETILVACSKCDWLAAFSRDDLITAHGADYAMPNLLDHLAAPSCSRLGSHWDRCGVHYVEPIETGSRGEYGLSAKPGSHHTHISVSDRSVEEKLHNQWRHFGSTHREVQRSANE